MDADMWVLLIAVCAPWGLVVVYFVASGVRDWMYRR